MKEPSSPQTKTDPGRPARETSVTLALRKRGFGPCDQHPSNRIFPRRARIVGRGKSSLRGVKEYPVSQTELRELNGRLRNKLNFIVVKFVLGSDVLVSRWNNNRVETVEFVTRKTFFFGKLKRMT